MICSGKSKNGAARGTRTPDPLITNEMLYRLSYCGDRRAVDGPAADAGLLHGGARIGKPESKPDASRAGSAPQLPTEQVAEEGLLALFCFLRLFGADTRIVRRAGEAFETLFLAHPGRRLAIGGVAGFRIAAGP